MFEKLNIKKLNYKASELLKNPQKGFIPALTAGSQNQGLNCYVPKSEATILKNVISLSANGDGIAFFQSGEFTILQDAYAIDFICKPNKISNNHYLFIVGAINKIIGKYNWNNKSGWNRVKDDKIKLPIKDENLGDDLENIDFKFMEDFIAELEAQRIAELEAYLITTNLKDYNLTTDEKQALKDFENLEWQEFKTTKIFDIKNTFNILSRDIIKNSGTIPYLCASAENNGVNTYIDYDENFKDKGNCIFIGGKTFVVSYQKTDFFSNDSHNLTLRLKNQIITKENQLFLASCVNKSLSYKYSWGNSVSNSKIKKEFINLPIKNGEINYKFMQNFIKAIEKLVIKDVVDFADEKISLTKKCIKTPCETK